MHVSAMSMLVPCPAIVLLLWQGLPHLHHERFTLEPHIEPPNAADREVGCFEFSSYERSGGEVPASCLLADF